jgi:SnoaL-like domain/Pyridoxamine 5'-phosphate oxidase
MLAGMSDRLSAVEAYQNALITGDVDAVAAHLAPGVVVDTNFGRAEGAEAVLALLREPRTAGLLAAGAHWSEPVTDADSITVTAELPATAPFGGFEFVFGFAGAAITRVEQQTLPAAPVQPVSLRLTGEIRNAVDGALDNGTPMLIAYSDDAGEIHLSFRGTIQAHSDDQLALWARDPEGGLPRHIASRPKVTLFYHDPASRTSYTFYGRARVEAEPAARAAIFENSHPRERQMDFRRRGVAIVVDLDKVEGRGPGGRILMLR